MIWTPQPTETPTRFTFSASAAACVGAVDHQFLMGGVAMAAAVDAAERATGKPLLWATIQFVSGGALGDTVDIEVKPLGGGRSISQVSVSLSVGDRLIQSLAAALGGRGEHPLQQFPAMPDVPPPEVCPAKIDDVLVVPSNLIDQFERRTAFEDPDTGREGMWIRLKSGMDVSAPLLALTSDFLLGAHEKTRGGTSLDNTIRIIEPVPSDWILSVTQMGGFRNGVAHGDQYQFAQDGTLLSMSSQTGLIPRRT